MRAGSLALIIAGGGLILASLLGYAVGTNSLNGQLASCNDAADQQYQEGQNSNPFPSGSTAWVEYDDQVISTYEQALIACYDSFNSGHENLYSWAAWGVVVGVVCLGAGGYFARQRSPVQTEDPSGASPPTVGPGSGT